MKASAYFLAGGESEDLIQEGLIGFFKAVRDYRVDREASFRSFAELCVTRQIITAIKTAARNKHSPLNTYVSFSHSRAGASGDQEMSLAEVLPGDPVSTRSRQVISSEELRSLVECLGEALSDLESGVLTMYLEGRSYEEIAEPPGLHPEDGRQRPAAGEAQGADAPAQPRGARPALRRRSGTARASLQQRPVRRPSAPPDAFVDRVVHLRRRRRHHALGHLELPPRQQPLILRGELPGAPAR